MKNPPKTRGRIGTMRKVHKQLSMEEATKDAEMTNDDTFIKEDVKGTKEASKSEAVRKARAMNKNAKGKQLALEEPYYYKACIILKKLYLQ
jgi:hypothetical protein